jgi:hypothetical protein
MQIKVQTDQLQTELVNEDASTLLLEIVWEFDGLYYPEKNWTDFACVIIGWWVSTVVKIMDGEDKVNFAFMDGPYSIEARYNREARELEMMPRGIFSVKKVGIRELIEALSQAVDAVYRKFVELGIQERERIFFKRYFEILEGYLSSLQ